MNRKQYEEDLARRQQAHLGSIADNQMAWQPCMHDQCMECHGTGIKSTGGSCVHAVHCPCPKCSPTC